MGADDMGATLEIINLLLAGLDVADRIGVDMAHLQAVRAKARSEGRDLTDAEVQALADDAQAALDALKPDQPSASE